MQSLSRDAVSGISRFIMSQQDMKSGFFNDRSGRPDLYYTAFGLACAAALGLKLENTDGISKSLSGIKKNDLDLVHLKAAMQTENMLKLLSVPGFIRKTVLEYASVGVGAETKNALANLIKNAPDGAFPNGDRNSPYSLFLGVTAYQDCALEIGVFEDAVSMLDSYTAADRQGAYSNMRGGAASLNPTLAAIHVKRIFSLKIADETVDFLRGSQLADGGFKASFSAPAPDMLSTALALFTLRVLSVEPKHDPRGFIDSHCLENGSFTATDLESDGQSDTEYTFYGLLASGSLKT